MFTHKKNLSDIAKFKSLGEASEEKKDYASAKKYFVQAGDADAFFNLGVMYWEMIPPDYVNARKYYEKSAVMGDLRAITNVASMYQDGLGGPKDEVKAFNYLEKALAKENTNGLILCNIGHAYRLGLGVPQDVPKAIQYFNRAAENSFKATAFYKLATTYYVGYEGVTQDYATSAVYHMAAAEAGCITSLFCLGVMFEKGEGLRKDIDKALKYLNEAADKGVIEAQLHLGRRYQYSNKEQSSKYFSKAAEQGNAEAFYNLGLNYEFSENYPEAIKYIRKAADKNLVEAIGWFDLVYSWDVDNYPSDLLVYHAGFSVVDNPNIRHSFNLLAQTETDLFISFLEENPDDTLDKLQGKLLADSFQHVCSTIKNKAAITFIAITHLVLHVPGLSSLILSYLVESAHLKAIPDLAKSPEKLNMPAALFRLFYHTEPLTSQLEEKRSIKNSNKI